MNRVVDAQAKLGCEMQEYFLILENPPSYVISAFVYSNAIRENFCRTYNL